MTHSLAPWKHASLSLSILILILSSVYFYMVEPALLKQKENLERFDTLSFQIKKLGDMEQNIADLNEQIVQLKEHNPNNLDFIKKKTSALVAADLQKLLKKLIESNGGNLVSTHAVTKPKDDVFSDITIKVHMRCNITTLRTVIYALATNKPLLFTDNLLIQKKSSRSSRKRKNTSTDQLEVRFDVTGYINQSTQ
jgi:type II secretion system (T2SS) protein M